jgi:O-antigen/teichoic acid export membrane protein
VQRNKQIRSLSIIIVGRVSLVLSQVASVSTISQILPPAEVGRTYILLSLASWFTGVLVGPVATYVERHLLEWRHERQQKTNYEGFLTYVVVSTLVSGVLLVAVHEIFGLGTSVRVPFLLWLTLGNVGCASLALSALNALNILGHHGGSVGLSNAISWGGIACALVSVRLGQPTAEYWITGLLFVQGVAAALGGIALWTVLNNQATTSDIRRSDALAELKRFDWTALINFCWPQSVGLGIYWLQTQGYRLVMASTVGSSAVGLFAVGGTIGSGLMIAFESVFNQFYQPIFYRTIVGQDRAGRAVAWNAYASAYLPTIVVVAVFVATGGPLMLKLLAGPRFADAGSAVTWSATVEATRMLTGAYQRAALAERDMRVLIMPAFSGAAVTLLGVWLLAPLDPLNGTGCSLLVGAVTVVVGTGIGLRRLSPIDLPWLRIAHASLLLSPMAVGLLVFRMNAPEPHRVMAALVLSIAAICTIVVLYLLSKEWLLAVARDENVENAT